MEKALSLLVLSWNAGTNRSLLPEGLKLHDLSHQDFEYKV